MCILVIEYYDSKYAIPYLRQSVFGFFRFEESSLGSLVARLLFLNDIFEMSYSNRLTLYLYRVLLVRSYIIL